MVNFDLFVYRLDLAELKDSELDNFELVKHRY